MEIVDYRYAIQKGDSIALEMHMDLQANMKIRKNRGECSDCRYWQELSLVQE